MKTKPTTILAALWIAFAMAAVAQDDAAANPVPEPDRLTVLRDSWQSARERALRPIDQTYQAELKKLLDEFTRAGRLEDALAVKNELETVAAGEAPPADVAAAVPAPATAPEKEPRHLRDLTNFADYQRFFAGTLWVSGTGPGISFAEDGAKIALFDGDPPAKLAHHTDLSLKEPGVLEFQWSNGAKANILVSEDLKTLKRGGFSLEKVEPE